jgi:predicted solute-binding protein
MSNDQGVFTLGHSPDPDDAFMFYAMAENKIDMRGYRFEHRLEDIQTLNERALRVWAMDTGRLSSENIQRSTLNAQRSTAIQKRASFSETK